MENFLKLLSDFEAKKSATNRQLLLNPNGGNVSVNSTDALSSLDVNGSLGLAIRTATAVATLGTSDSTIVFTSAVTQPVGTSVNRRTYTFKNANACILFYLQYNELMDAAN